MKFLADENIPLKVVEELRQMNIDILSLSLLKPGATDYEAAQIAQKEKKIIITFDKDFGRLIF